MQKNVIALNTRIMDTEISDVITVMKAVTVMRPVLTHWSVFYVRVHNTCHHAASLTGLSPKPNCNSSEDEDNLCDADDDIVVNKISNVDVESDTNVENSESDLNVDEEDDSDLLFVK